MKTGLFISFILSLFVFTGCGSQADSVSVAEQLPNSDDILAIHVGGIDEEGFSNRRNKCND